MARANFVKAAAKDYPDHGIKKGESYYWWKFRFGGKCYSKTPPRRSQLTQSNFLSQLYDIEDAIGGMTASDVDDFNSQRDDFAQQIRDLGEECQSSLDNMPDSLQQGPTGEMLQGRIDECESYASDIESVEIEEPEDPGDEPERADFPAGEEGDKEFATQHERWQEKVQDATDAITSAIEELQGLTYNGE